MKGLKTILPIFTATSFSFMLLVNVAGLGISDVCAAHCQYMAVRQLTVGSDIKDIEHIYVLSNEEYSASNYLVGERLANRYPKWPTGAL